MRIITGTARGTKLETLEGEATRPTTDRVKESIFNIIQFEIEGRSFLDLFAGSGQMALEALSRGAENALISDLSKEAIDIIKNNAKKAKLYDRCRVLCSDYKTVIRGLRGKESFDIIFLDPPYKSGLLKDALDKLAEADVISQGGIVICESDSEVPPICDSLMLDRHVKYGKTYITVFRKENGADD